MSSNCSDKYLKAQQQCKNKHHNNDTELIKCINKAAGKLNKSGCKNCAESMNSCLKDLNSNSEHDRAECMKKSLQDGCIRDIPCINSYT